VLRLEIGIDHFKKITFYPDSASEKKRNQLLSSQYLMLAQRMNVYLIQNMKKAS
jgi:hypothetical protein